ncbi:ExeM/NucH family extracellular endonuclease [Hymenobacter sp. BT770]|uniref:ExeM/NucH family extracellular endonuclease n=1 Tax=Hymenobacter sp. BT770 TaxID=2886942 RepID=UPI001D11892A|nr:ExeM/NucH family extracellular endonuclease [Hymenobacter sp. BT770]MCC3154199.1 ExeM/NucH family extracellular endonuclease [Hymenobacter sp. BT770]MDO3414354.1 ExeM/NucH family extracellular endonuclease [Hymenobacter sp. BT770]
MKLFTKTLLLVAAYALASASAQAQQVTPIGVIQGSGALAAAGTYTIEGVVTGVYAGLSPAGFYVQNDAADADGNAATSDALFVVQTSPTVAVGDQVRITGAVEETAATPSFGQAVLTGPAVAVVSVGHALPTFTTLDNATFSSAAAEQYEGMLVQFSAPVTVSDVAALKSRGELTLATQGLIYQPTQFVDPNDDPASGTSSTGTGNVAAVGAYQAANTARSFILDDGRAATNLLPIPYLDAATQTVRVGSTVARLRGILGYGNSKWRVQPLAGPDAPVLTVVRPPVPTFGPIAVKVASFNVLNYFNGDGAGAGFPTARGATTLADFNRQRSKILTALTQMNADVVGLIEIENDGTGANSAIQDIVNGLNQALGAGTYAFVNDGILRQPNNTDLIHCAIIYKPAVVTAYGNVLIASATGIFERPPVAQLFITNRTAAPDTFALVVNHFKSKASGSGANADQGDGQGPSNLRRKGQATGLVQFINGTVKPVGTRYVVSVGDYNANYEEDPIDILRAAGLVVGSPASSASYVFSGLSGSLDHAVLTPNLVGHAAVEKWHINASEPEFLEYDEAGTNTNTTSPFRSSDHDPVLIGLNFRSTVTATRQPYAAVQMQVFPNPAAGAFNLFIAAPAPTLPLTLEVVSLLGQSVLVLQGTAAELQAEISQRTAHLAAGTYVLRLSGAAFSQVQRVVKL